MSTGNGSKARKAGETRAVGLGFTTGRLIVELKDGREVSIPLSRYPSLQRAKSSQRNEWIMLGSGSAFRWASLDLDLSVRGLVSGLPEVIPAPPRLRKRSTRAFSKGAA
jgi:hypothetical protein